MHRHRRTVTALDQINLTSMLDVAFVLLLVFMIVAPSLKSGIDIKVPGNVPGTQPQAEDENTVIVSIGKREEGQTLDRIYPTRKGREASRVANMEELADELKTARLHSPKTNVTIQVDKDVPSETFIRVIRACEAAGIEAVDIPTEPPRTAGANGEKPKS